MNVKLNIENIKVKKPYLKVACILDNFSYSCLKYECNLLQLNINNWKNIIINEKPDLLLVESAWRGIENSWRGKIGGINKDKNNSLKFLVRFCNKLDIPTIFWNKEDPYHFKHFIDTAKLFKYIFTTDEDCIPIYKEILKHDRVYLLPFAAQPQIHNPIDKDKEKIGNIAFAGTWYTVKHAIRRKNLEFLLTPALKYNIDIYDRTYNYTYPEKANYIFPPKYQPYIKGYLPYKDMIKTYKKYKIFLNVNSLNDSKSMFSRRIVELLACGTSIISSYALSVEKIFPSVVKLAKNKEETDKYITLLLNNKNLRDKLSLIGQRKVFNEHTYTYRLENILDKIGLQYDKYNIPGVSIITVTNNLNYIKNILENYIRQNYRKKELIIIINNSNLSINQWKEDVQKYPKVKIIQVDENQSLGYYYNLGIHNCEYDYISKFDEVSYYGPDFLVDLMNAFEYADTEIVGKLSHYCYLKDKRKLILKFPNYENQYANILSTSALIIKKALFNTINIKDNSGENLWKDFFKECNDKHVKLYSIDRFNFVNVKKDLSEDTSNLLKENNCNNFNYIKTTDDYITPITI